MLRQLNLKEPVSFFRSYHESSMLAVALEDFSLMVIDVDTRTVVRKFVGHSAQITDATFSPNSRWLITSSMDCSIRTWDIPSAQLIDEFRTESACVSLNMSPTGECIATAHVDYLGIFLWNNRTLYSHVTLKAITPTEEPPLVQLPEVCDEIQPEEVKTEMDELEFLSPEQISDELITLSGLSTSRWQHLLNIDAIRKKNKPKQPLHAPKTAPFFLPTIPSLNIQFDLSAEKTKTESKLLMPQIITNLTKFGKLLNAATDFVPVIDALKQFGPSMIEFELNSLCPEAGGSIDVMLQFMKCIEFMLKSNRDFELAQAYLAVFMRTHGKTVASEAVLRNYLPNVQSCFAAGWNRIQEKLLYSICIVNSLKTM